MLHLINITSLKEERILIDAEGFRSNVGIILANAQGELLWARRCGQNAWQFPQGGIKPSETPEDALFRELKEEVGLDAEQVEVLGVTSGWLRYRLPKRLVRRHNYPVCIGQKQKWFLLKMLCDDSQVSFTCSATPEFDRWRWVNYWHPVIEVVDFKREVYQQALTELEEKLKAQLS